VGGAGERRSDVGVDLQEGLSAYAEKQAHILRDMGQAFADKWYPELARSGVEPEGWPEHYLANRSSVELPPLEELLELEEEGVIF